MMLGVHEGEEPGATPLPSGVVTTEEGDRLTITISTDLDCGTGPGLYARLRDLVVITRARLITMDIAGVDFCDCAGARVLAAIHRLASDQGIDCRLRGPRPHVVWLLQTLDAGYLTAPEAE
ncbi:STAS domain-containing protein [Actinoplanes sp. NEAU-A12]|uniref:STAS domain-containing protein n=1 Tax=Actinoplanes sandaracinus TaxID=3045177 RepID=A0ABT6WYJ5_9ACTN|nr:STAS domain-containing protein [Actinoplanes sandaracinus]MDI6104806.1 STAS domain-containing protein [Actinoplanes sandaracinus]